jgi:uncharacterized peroxidase-related enzyme
MTGPVTAPVTALDIPEPEEGALSPQMQAYFARCREKLGLVPNVLRAHAFDEAKLSAFIGIYNDLMLAPSGLTKTEREMIAVAVSAENRCVYCLTAHGAALRELTGDPALAEVIAQNWRAAPLPARQRAILAFAVKLTRAPAEMSEADRAALRDAGLSEREIWDTAAVAAFFNMSNRLAAAVEMQPNPDYHHAARTPRA